MIERFHGARVTPLSLFIVIAVSSTILSDGFRNVKPVLRLAAAKGLQVIINWEKNNGGSIVGFVCNCQMCDNETRTLTTPCIQKLRICKDDDNGVVIIKRGMVVL